MRDRESHHDKGRHRGLLPRGGPRRARSLPSASERPWACITLLGLAAALLAACGPKREPSALASDAKVPAASAEERETGGAEKAEAPPSAEAKEAVAGTGGDTEEPEPRLQNGATSEWELGERVLQALKDRNRAALHALRITEKEYREHVFPEFDEAKGTIPVDLHWYHLNVRSHAGLEDALDSYGGKSMELLDVLPTKGITKYATYELWNKVELMVRFPDGQTAQVRIFGSVVHMDGRWKLLSFPS